MTTPSDRLLTTREVAALFGVDPRTVTVWVRAGRIPALLTPGGQRRFKESEVRAHLGIAGANRDEAS